MTQFTEDPIETLEDWNAVLVSGGAGFDHCCCEMPGCPVPTKECESQSASESFDAYWPIGQPPGTSGDDLVPRMYKAEGSSIDVIWNGRSALIDSLRFGDPNPNDQSFEWKALVIATATNEGDQTFDYFYTLNERDVDGICTTSNPSRNVTYGWSDSVESDLCELSETRKAAINRLTYQTGGSEPALVGCPGPFFTSYVEWEDMKRDSITSITVSDPVTPEELVTDAEGNYSGEWLTPGTCSSSLSYAHGLSFAVNGWPLVSGREWPTCEDALVIGTPLRCDVRKSRFRWVIPDTFKGSYFKRTWDILEEPDGWDADPPTAHRSYFLKDQTWEWTGPGDPLDPDSWKSPWFEIPPPSAPGTRRVVNHYRECYRSPFGHKPQKDGEEPDMTPPGEDLSEARNSYHQPRR